MSDGEDVYQALSFEVRAEFDPDWADEEGTDYLRVETQGSIMNALFDVKHIGTMNVEPSHPGGGSGGRWEVKASLSQPIDPTEYSRLHSEVKQSLKKEAEDVEWLTDLSPDWDPSAPPG